MVWPTGKPLTTAFDSDDDPISTARPELQTMSTTVGEMVDAIDTSGITNGQVLVYNASQSKFLAGDQAGGDVIEDTTPQLGGDLDLNGFAIIDNSDSTGSPVTFKSDRIIFEPSGGSDSAGDEPLRIEKPLDNIGNPLYSGNAWRIMIGNYSGAGAMPTHMDMIYDGHLDGNTKQIIFNSGDGSTTNPVKIDSNTLHANDIRTNAITSHTTFSGEVIITGDLRVSSGGSQGKITNDSLTNGKITIFNDKSETGGMLEVGQADIILKPGPSDSGGAGGDSAGQGFIDFQTGTTTSIGTNGSADATTTNPVGYLEVKVNGTEYLIPYYNIA